MHKDVTLAFLDRFTTQDQADWLSTKRLAAWLHSVSYRGGVPAETLYARLAAAPRGTTGPHAAVHAVTTTAFVALLRTWNTQIRALEHSIADQLDAHPDVPIFTSLPPVRDGASGPGCSPRSATPGDDSPPPTPSPPWPASPRPRASRAR